MYCSNCGAYIDPRYNACGNCGMYFVMRPMRPRFYTAGFVLGILSLCIPYYGVILGIIGLPMAIISKRRSSIIMNILGITIWVAIFVLAVALSMSAATIFMQSLS